MADDDGLRDIQLSAKHLVSLFMTGAVVLVVTFLCGVLVGRGVRAQKEPTAAADALAPAADPTASVAALQPVTKATPQPPSTEPPPPEEDLSYYSRLEGKTAPPESVKGAAGAPRADTAPKSAEPARRVAAPPKPAEPAKRVVTPPKPAAEPKPAPPTASADPAGSGYVLKIVAYRNRAQATALASRLSGKGYAAYVVPVSSRGTPLYSVRVGKFKARADAEAARRRLEKEERLKPLITR